MVERRTKALYYSLASVPMRANGYLYRVFRQGRFPIKAHLGCGQVNYIPGWVNVDANIVTAKRDLWANLSNGLPFRDLSVEKIYSYHMIEHLPDSYLQAHCAEMFRVLIPGGVIRVGGPNIDNACLKLLENDASWFGDYPDKRESIGGRFVNFLFCRGEHLTALTKSYLSELAQNAGFVDLTFCAPVKETVMFDPQVLGYESESDDQYPHTIVMEARKPKRV